MLMGGDCNLNSIYSCTDALKQGLKQTMINQELLFMRQVHELHRLYRIQTAMMEDFKWKGLDHYSLHKRGTETICKNKYNQAQRFMILSENFILQPEDCMLSGFKQKSLDLQLSADQFICHSVEDCTEKDSLRNSLKEPIESKNLSKGVIVSDAVNLKLSMSIGEDTGKNIGDHRSSIANKTSASSSDIIDLECPYFRISNNDTYLELASGFAANSSSKDEHKLENFSQIGMRKGSPGTSMSKALFYFNPTCEEQTPSDSGLNGHRKFLYADLMSKKQVLGGCKTNILDLNRVQPENSPYFSDNYSTVYIPSKSSFSSVLDKVYSKCTMASSSRPPAGNKVILNRSTDSSAVCQQFDLNFDLSCKDSDREERDKDDVGGKISFVDLDSDSGEDPCGNRSNPKNESVDSSSKLSNGLLCDRDVVNAVGAEASLERDAESSHLSEYQMTAERPLCHKPSSSSESDCVIDQQSSSLKTMHSVTKCGECNFSKSDERQKGNLDPLSDHSGEQDQKSSDSTESNILSTGIEELEADVMVQTAAELLVQISLETRVAYLGGLTKSQNKEDDQPQRSWDTYEAMVLNAKESDPDDYFVSSDAFRVEEPQKKDSRYKLKRGTRMKDFQRDVLPSLSILSRHEIREDVNIMEGVIKSREYKRMSAKMGDVGDWFRPVRSKRSRVRCSRTLYA